MKKKAKQEIYFAVCINNKRYQASLEIGKLYRIIPDEEAESMDIYEWSMKVVRTTDILRIVSFDLKYPGHSSKCCCGHRPKPLLA